MIIMILMLKVKDIPGLLLVSYGMPIMEDKNKSKSI